MQQLRLLGQVTVDRINPIRAESTGNQAEVDDDSSAPRFRSRRTVGLLGYLVTAMRPLSRERLAGLLWPADPTSTGRTNLRRELHNLTQILPGCWESSRHSVAFFASSNTTVDIYQLTDLERQRRWEEAAGLVGGSFLEDLYLEENLEFEQWLLSEREKWRSLSEKVLRRCILGHIRRGRYNDALDQAQKLLRLAPWDEETHRQVMRLLAWTGQRNAAMRQFEECKLALEDELDVRPAIETISLYGDIKAGTLDLPPQLPAFLSAERARHDFERNQFVGRESIIRQLDHAIRHVLAGQSRIIFVTGGPGRGKTALMDVFADKAMEIHPGLLVTTGKCNAYAGIGDPYLPFRQAMSMLSGDLEGRWDAGAISRTHAQRLWAASSFFIQILLDQGPLLLNVFVPGKDLHSRVSSAGEEYAPWLPQLRAQLDSLGRQSEGIERNLLFQQFTNVIKVVSQENPLLLIVDDLQWADSASISLLFHLGRSLPNLTSRLLILCAYRPEEIAVGHLGQRHPLAGVLSEFRRTENISWIDLAKGDGEEEEAFINALLDLEPNKLANDFRTALHKRTKGHPLFTLDLLNTMRDRGDLIKDEAGAWIEGPTLDWQLLPAKVEAVIEERIDRLPMDLQDILMIASVEGESFTAEVVSNIRNSPERLTLRLLSFELERQHRLVREREEIYTGRRRLTQFNFAHILYRDFLYMRLSQGERRLLHGQVGNTLEELYESQLDKIAVQLAHHYSQAGKEERACYFFTVAGDRAAHLYESDESISNYSRAIELAQSAYPQFGLLAELHYKRGLIWSMVGEFETARNDYEMAMGVARATSELLLEWRALLALGRLWASRNYQQACNCFQRALEIARQMNDPLAVAKSLNWIGNWSANDANFAKADAYHREAFVIFEKLGDKKELANTLDLLGLANLLGGNLNASVHYYDKAIALTRERDDLPRLASSLTGRATTTSALIWLASCPPPQSRDPMQDIDESLRYAKKIGSASEEIWSYWSISLLQLLYGDYGAALEAAQLSLQIATDIGHREWVVGNKWAMGRIYAELFSDELALEYLTEAFELARELRSPTWIHIVGADLAYVYLIQGKLALCVACLDDVLPIDASMDSLGRRCCWIRRAQLFLAKDLPCQALEITNRLIASAAGLTPDSIIPFLWLLKAQALVASRPAEDRGEDNLLLADVRNRLSAAIDNAKSNTENIIIWQLHAAMAEHLRLMGLVEEAVVESRKMSTSVDEIAHSIPGKTLRQQFIQGTRQYVTTVKKVFCGINGVG